MKITILSKLTFAFIFSSIFLSCEKEEIALPAKPVTAGEQSAPSGPETPGNPKPSTSDSVVVPKPPSVPQAPATPGLLKKITWAPLDYKLFEYNSENALIKYITQYNSVQGTDIVTRDEYTYSYNSAGQVSEVTTKQGARTVYSYNGQVWAEALSYDLLNRPLKKYQFQFNDKKQLVEYRTFKIDLANNGTPESKVTLQYDINGNLTRWKEFYYNPGSKEFSLSVDLAFSNFDNKKFAKNSMTFGYILQPINFWVNNPGRKEFVGNASPVENYTYTYDTDGYPISKKTSYSYEKPLPTLNAVFTY
jgi:YD repeat-containing protein